MDFLRIGEKLIDPQRVHRGVDRVLTLRRQGFSQQEVAVKLKLERSFISRLENLGEVRKGKKLGLLGFPLQNKEEIRDIAEKAGFDFIILMNDEERWQFVRERSGMDFFNEMMAIIARLRACDTIIILGSSKWINLGEALLDRQVLYLELGETPIEGDVYLDPSVFEDMLKTVLEKGEEKP
jgi:transcriptional regulator with XRE-family HTH domain